MTIWWCLYNSTPFLFTNGSKLSIFEQPKWKLLRMSPTFDVSQNGNLKHQDSSSSIFEIRESDLSRLLEKPRPVNIERKRSFDERSFSELSISSPPRAFYRNNENSSRVFDSIHSPAARSGVSTPRSFTCVEMHPIVSEAWVALQRSVVHFRGQPVGTIAALDHSTEELNYDQVDNYFRFDIHFFVCDLM